MKKINSSTVFFPLFIGLPFVMTVGGYFYIASQHVGPPTLDQLRAQYPACEQRQEFVTNYVKERQQQPIELSLKTSSTEFMDRPATSLEDWWKRYRAGAEDILERQDRREFIDTLYDLGRDCWQ